MMRPMTDEERLLLASIEVSTPEQVEHNWPRALEQGIRTFVRDVEAQLQLAPVIMGLRKVWRIPFGSHHPQVVEFVRLRYEIARWQSWIDDGYLHLTPREEPLTLRDFSTVKEPP